MELKKIYNSILNMLEYFRYKDTFPFIIACIIIGINYIEANDKNKSQDETITSNMYIIIFTFLFYCSYAAYKYSSQLSISPYVPAFVNLFFVIIFIMIITFVKLDSQNFERFVTITGFISILIVVIALAIIFQIFSNYLKSLSGWSGFIVELIFYIPCLLVQFVNYILDELKITSNSVLILFIIEIILLLVYIYLPKLLNHISEKEGVPILEGSEFLNKENIYAVDATMPDKLDIQLAGNVNKTQYKNYSISFWTYLNTHSKSKLSYNTETTIFNYGGGNPKVTYFNSEDENKSKDVYRIYFTNNTDLNTNANPDDDFKPYYEIKLPSQRWNNLVFNYSSTHADLFINGYLERTFKFVGNIPKYSAGDVIKTGSNNGIHGAISNIRYYPKTLSKHRISSMYNVFMNKKPPTINL